MRKLAIVLVIGLVIAVAIGAIGCDGKETPTPTPIPTPEPTIPPNFTTYTDKDNIFSISYPKDWELRLQTLEDLEEAVKDWIYSIDSNVPLENSHALFLAVRPSATGIEASFGITIEPLLAGFTNIDSVVDGQMRWLKNVATNVHEFSRIKTTVDGREAVIVDAQAFPKGGVEVRALDMVMIQGKVVWGINCQTSPKEFGNFDDTFRAIIWSFRILK